MRHPFLEHIARALADVGVASWRYEFPYMQRGSRWPDRPEIAEARVREAVRDARDAAGGVPLIAGGKSFGGRMTSQAQAREALPGVGGLVFLGFPLHPPGRPDTSRAEHLFDVQIPMLFLQGTRDEFARLNLLQSVVTELGDWATLHLIEGGDHSFKVARRDAIPELARAIADWTDTVVIPRGRESA